MYNRILPAIKAGGFIISWLIIDFLLYILIIGGICILMEKSFNISDTESYSTAEMVMMTSVSFIATFFVIHVFQASKNWNFSLTEVGLTNNSILPNLIKGVSIGALLVLFTVLPLIVFDAINIKANTFIIADLAGYVLIFSLVAVYEELLTRGYLLSYLEKHYSRVIAVLISAIIFSLLHIFNGNFNLLECFNLILVGIFLAALKFRYQNLWVPVGTHFSWNFIQGSVLSFPVSGIDIPSIYLISFEENTIFNGGLFGIEGSFLSTVIFIALVIYFRNTFIISE